MHFRGTLLFAAVLAAVPLAPASAQVTAGNAVNGGCVTGATSSSPSDRGAYSTQDGLGRTCTQDASYSKSVSMSVGTVYSAARAIHITVTGGGNVSLTLSAGGTLVFTLPVGDYTLPFSVTEVNSSGTTATATYANVS